MRNLVIVLLLASAAFGQRRNPDPVPIPRSIAKPYNAVYGDVVMPSTKVDLLQMMAGKIVWKHFYRRLPPNNFNPRRMVVWIDNETHPSPTESRNGVEDWLRYDPRKLRISPQSISFDAPAGDHIFYIVGSR